MSRSKWKGPFVNFKQLDKINTITRNSLITQQFVEASFQVYNGKTYSELTATDSMVGHKFGEFVFTRAKFNFKKKK